MERSIHSDAFHQESASKKHAVLARCKDIGRQTCKFLITSGSSNAAPALDERALPLPEANLADAAWWAAWPEKREVRAEMVLGAGGDLQFCSIGLPDPSDKYLDRLMSTPE